MEQGIVVPVEAEEALAETEGQAQTGILVSIDKELIGVLSVSDPLKPEAPEVISILKSMNIESMIVTGDNWGTANAIAKQVGIERKHVVAEAKPEQKAEKVKELQVGTCSILLEFYEFAQAQHTHRHIQIKVKMSVRRVIKYSL